MARLALASCAKVNMYGFSLEADDFHYFDSLVQEKVTPPQRDPRFGHTHKFARELSHFVAPPLRFAYTVQEGDISYDLDFVDAHSLERGFDITGAVGSILMMSTNPAVAADIDLALVGAAGSLSNNSALIVDGATPYITGLDIDADDGSSFTLGDRVPVVVRFSAAVSVVGALRIKMETGAIDRYAVYVNGTNTTVLTFEYVVETGDGTSLLDYHSDETKFRSSAAAFDLSRGAVMRYSARPMLAADVHLNPAGGVLGGLQSATMVSGTSVSTMPSITVASTAKKRKPSHHRHRRNMSRPPSRSECCTAPRAAAATAAALTSCACSGASARSAVSSTSCAS